jgi:nitrite reductase (NADH) small subunit
LKHLVCKLTEIQPGEKMLVNINKKSIIVARNSEEELTAFYSRCPHHGADLNRSFLTYETASNEPGKYEICKDNEMIRCPWHGFEFDTKSGCSIVDTKLRLKTFKVSIEEKNVIVEI